MDVAFATEQLRKCYQDRKVRTKAWGEKIGRLYVRRVDALHAAESAQVLRSLKALRFHALTGNREGQYAIDIDESYRLIVTFHDKGMTIVRVEEVSKHYDD